MTCPRCHGLMVLDHPFRFGNSELCDCAITLDEPTRCVNCGNVLSDEIIRNRSRHLHDETRALRTVGACAPEEA